MTEELLIHTISNIGVPTALCFYVLFTLNKSVNNLNKTMNNWSDLIKKHIELIEQRLTRLEDKVNHPNH